MSDNKAEKSFQFKEGEVLLINKPYTWTSFQVVNKIRYSIKHFLGVKKIKVGHAGTLDPLATGLLILCTGKFTKRIDEFQAQEKEYTGTFVLGATTPSFDLETEIDHTFETEHLNEALIHSTITQFIGDLDQIPPVFSAIKVDGKRAYLYARKNEEVVIKPKQIHISEFEITDISLPEIKFRIVCSKGTYIRSLARDFGKALNSGAYLSVLKRTRIGEFRLQDAIEINDFQEMLTSLKKD
jgi:tRNA pseudouridine55 synthase